MVLFSLLVLRYPLKLLPGSLVVTMGLTIWIAYSFRISVRVGI
jgi:hypothetical protein